MTCAVRYAHATASEYGGDDERVTFVGNSQGAVTGLIVALAGEQFGQGCQVPDGDATIDAFVGYEGPYNWAQVPSQNPAVNVAALESTEPGVWSAVDPYTHIGGNPDLEVHLVHGDDTNVAWYEIARSVSEELHAEPADAGYDTKLTLIDGSHLALGSGYEVGFDQAVEAAVKVAKG